MTLIRKGSLVVSAQAREDNPLHGPIYMAAMALAARDGGASTIRANGPEDIAAIKAVCDLPIIGISKLWDARFPVYITPNRATADKIKAAGAEIIGIDATQRPRDGGPVEELIAYIRDDLKCEVFADVDTLENGLKAAAARPTYVATTMAGYTDETEARKGSGPDFELLEALVRATDIPVVAEGRFWEPSQVARALELGAHAVVIGTAITNPRDITRRFVTESGAC
ncbi:N-acetylmannosamine-6-phosphate 2-epimerase [Lacibacterium aquatile]|uniref:N-acylglucosamine-6-phosphate 2-epimerase n=1 Tax=Lacibacterium aquatile TaxID=1168082 RepID=A0ABW5DRL3_9PROT